MKLRYKVLLGLIVTLVLLLIVPVLASAANGGEALNGLKEFFVLLVNLAQKGLEGYIEFLKAI